MPKQMPKRLSAVILAMLLVLITSLVSGPSSSAWADPPARPAQYYFVLQSAAHAAGDGTIIDVTGLSSLTVTTTGTFVGTITFYASTDAANFFEIEGVSPSDKTITGTTMTGAGSRVFPLRSAQKFKAKITAWTSGNITITGSGNASPAWSLGGGGGGLTLGAAVPSATPYSMLHIDGSGHVVQDVYSRMNQDGSITLIGNDPILQARGDVTGYAGKVFASNSTTAGQALVGTFNTNGFPGVNLQTNGSAVAGTTAGVTNANQSSLLSTGGPLLIGSTDANPVYLITNGVVALKGEAGSITTGNAARVSAASNLATYPLYLGLDGRAMVHVTTNQNISIGDVSGTSASMSGWTAINDAGGALTPMGYRASYHEFLGSVHFIDPPTATTQSAGDNSTKLATTAYVDTAVAGAGGAYSGAKVVRTTDQNVNDGAATTIVTWSSASRDTDSYWSGGSPTRLTIPSTGMYRIEAQVNLSSAIWWIATIRLNGTDHIAGQMRNSTGSGGASCGRVSIEDSFTAGDYVELNVGVDGSGHKVLYDTTWRTWMTITRVK